MKAFRVLFVDDEAEFLETLLKRLGKRGLKAESCHSGLEALELLERQPFDVVVLDVKMPGMGGIEALHTIKDRYPLIEVIMLTGHADMEAAISGMEEGAFDYLMKPMDIDDLHFKIQDAYKRKSLQEQRIALAREAGSGHQESGRTERE